MQQIDRKSCYCVSVKVSEAKVCMADTTTVLRFTQRTVVLYVPCMCCVCAYPGPASHGCASQPPFDALGHSCCNISMSDNIAAAGQNDQSMESQRDSTGNIVPASKCHVVTYNSYQLYICSRKDQIVLAGVR